MVSTTLKQFAYITLFVGIFYCQPTLALTKVTASIDKNPAMINESITLTVIADDDINRDGLDTSILEQDFMVGRSSVSSQTSMVNFKTSRTTTWQIVLIARTTGNLVIPALSIEGQQSQPINIEVLEKSSSQSNKQQDIFVTSELSSTEVYVQQLLTLTLKLHFSVELKSGSLTEPSLINANIEKIGQDQQSDGIINGKRYRIIEQTYAITPEQSGQFKLEAPVFSGEIMTQSRRRSNFLSFAETKPVSIIGDPIKLNVLPIPDSFLNHNSNQSSQKSQWLPSELLTLHQEWQANEGKFIAGEPITRTITLTAAGLSKAQLPKLTMQAVKGLKVYPDQAQLHSNLSKERLVSQKTQNFAIVASHAGTFELPEIAITWFNTVTNRVQQAVLPAETITVLANEDTINSGYSNKYQKNQLSDSMTASTVPVVSQHALPVLTENTQQDSNSALQWLFLTLWILTTLAWLSHITYLKRKKQPKSEIEMLNSDGKIYLSLLAACKKNEAQQVLDLILPWLNQLYATDSTNKITTLSKAQTVVNQQNFITALHDLQQHLYSKNAANGAIDWQSSALLEAIVEINKLQSKQRAVQVSLKLNP